MKEHICQIVSKEKLVAYADGELLASEEQQIAEHIATCPDCQAITEALKRSLEVTQAIWRDSEAQWPKAFPTKRLQSNKRLRRKMATVAAGILLLLGAAAVWQKVFRPTERARISREQALTAEIKRKITDSGNAAQLLAASELLSKYPETQSMVKERYQYIVETYPQTAAAAEARLKVQQFK